MMLTQNQNDYDYIEITSKHLKVSEIIDIVRDPTAGGISCFVGTTRDSFDGKTVLSLEYEAYEKMAMKVLERLASEARSSHEGIVKIAIFHRLGEVPVAEPSVVIAVSSVHRKPAISATEYLIDNLKASCPIWKKEVYKQADSQWKANSSWKHTPYTQTPDPSSVTRRLPSQNA